MNRIRKIGILLVLSLSVYFIYQKTCNSFYTITTIGDKTSLGINSYGIKDYGYIDYYKDELEKTKDKVEINNTYSNKNQSIHDVLLLIKNTPDIKRTLYDTNILVLTLGYNDLLYSYATEDNSSNLEQTIEDSYNELIKEIRKYYKEDIVVVGYYVEKDNIFINQEIRKLNKILENNKEVIFIDSYNLLKNREKYFQNKKSIYPNREGYYVIAQKIIQKILEKKENI